jgi:hypothetical protein
LPSRENEKWKILPVGFAAVISGVVKRHQFGMLEPTISESKPVKDAR